MSMIVDTLRLSEDFKAVGFAEPQARALADKFRLLVDERLVTREYLDFKLQELRHDIEGKLSALEGRLNSMDGKLSDHRHDMDGRLNSLEGKLKELRYSMTLSLGSLMVAILTFFKVMDHFWR